MYQRENMALLSHFLWYTWYTWYKPFPWQNTIHWYNIENLDSLLTVSHTIDVLIKTVKNMKYAIIAFVLGFLMGGCAIGTYSLYVIENLQ